MTQANIDIEALRKLNRRFIHNFVTNDVPGHDAILHPEFIAIGPSGAYQDRASYLREWANGFDPKVITYWDMRDECIAVFADLALIRATNRWVRQINGAPTLGMTCYTDTYVRVRSQWLCVQAQLTPVASSNFPPDDTVVCQYRNGVQVLPITNPSDA
jgi:hypothetical protein